MSEQEDEQDNESADGDETASPPERGVDQQPTLPPMPASGPPRPRKLRWPFRR